MARKNARAKIDYGSGRLWLPRDLWIATRQRLRSPQREILVELLIRGKWAACEEIVERTGERVRLDVGECIFSLDGVAKTLGVTRDVVRRARDRFVRLGWIAVRPATGADTLPATLPATPPMIARVLICRGIIWPEAVPDTVAATLPATEQQLEQIQLFSLSPREHEERPPPVLPQPEPVARSEAGRQVVELWKHAYCASRSTVYWRAPVGQGDDRDAAERLACAFLGREDDLADRMRRATAARGFKVDGRPTADNLVELERYIEKYAPTAAEAEREPVALPSGPIALDVAIALARVDWAIWARALEHLKATGAKPNVVERYITTLQPVSVDQEGLLLRALDERHAEWVMDHRELLEEPLGMAVRVMAPERAARGGSSWA